MKFNDGFWLLKSGVKASYGLQVTDITQDQTGYSLHVSTKPIRHRGDTLGGPLLSVKVHSPTEGVIGIRIDHFKHAEKNPSIPLFPDVPATPNFSTSKAKGCSAISTGGLTATITENPYTITFKDTSRTLTFVGPKHQAIYDVPSRWTLGTAANSSCLTLDPSSNPSPVTLSETVRYVHSELNLSPGELIYGLGEQFGAFVKNGQSVSLWNQDGGTSSEQAYKCVPFYITNRNYGIFINHPGEVEVEVGSEKVSRVGVSVAGESLEYFVIYGETPLQILERYTRMTGRPALLPAWSFGLWLTTSFLTSYSNTTVSGFLQGMKDRDCNVRVFHLDCFWMKQYEWCSFTFDPENFPDPKAYLAEIKEKYNVKVCLWINPYISQLSPVFQEGVEGGYLIKRSDGTPWQWDLWQPGLAVVDITNPAARKWYCDKLSALVELGVDTFKTDFGERIPHANIKYFDESDPMRMHNTYAVLYNQMVFELLQNHFGKGEALVFARASAAGGQRFPVHWGGDCESTFEAMAEALRGALSLTVSGFGFASHDIGGFEGHPPPEIYQRWVAFGLFSTHSRLHGSSSYRVPWNYGEDAAKTMAKFVDAKHRLMPYIYTEAIQTHDTGHPLMRAMFLEFSEDRTTHYLDRQYMLGPSLLVAPVFVPIGEETEYYLPAGRWTSYFHPERTLQGPTWVREVVPLDEIPVWVREGSIVCLGPTGMKQPDYRLNVNLEVHLFGPKSATVYLPDGNGKTAQGLEVEASEGAINVLIANESVTVSSIVIYKEGMRGLQVSGGSTTHLDGGIGVKVDVEGGAKEVNIRY
ncbi:glycoside hydrolase family 31 protein [Coniophora puteana RWD-64-598 SS2]|uniref:alpha-D-xyloside xylohydrolase n=1 Tax=Coniophora puteana (strain RWD-64-598) TaxID=741705 RepID=A0A5M3N1I8_CONPW|nr:glycoside hydrolase family 31 protein [Coniophora puteana RWD-64-598 SS2]EIW85270.1 glycoside hydrolase family 31 protein [Coniophora puteana RWD-64-598 SS2]